MRVGVDVEQRVGIEATVELAEPLAELAARPRHDLERTASAHRRHDEPPKPALGVHERPHVHRVDALPTGLALDGPAERARLPAGLPMAVLGHAEPDVAVRLVEPAAEFTQTDAQGFVRFRPANVGARSLAQWEPGEGPLRPPAEPDDERFVARPPRLAAAKQEA